LFLSHPATQNSAAGENVYWRAAAFWKPHYVFTIRYATVRTARSNRSRRWTSGQLSAWSRATEISFRSDNCGK